MRAHYSSSGVSLVRRCAACLVVVSVLGSALAARASGSVIWPSEKEEVARGLSSSVVAERRKAATRLSRLPPTLSAPLVLLALKDPDLQVRRDAAQVAAAGRTPGAGRLVLSWLQAPEAETRLFALRVLSVVPEAEASGPIGRALSDPEASVRLVAVQAAAALGGEAAILLSGHLADRDARVRLAVVRELSRLKDQKSVIPLLSVVDDPDPELRREVLHALGSIGDTRSITAVFAALRDRDERVRLEALRALGAMGNESAAPALAAFLRERPREVEQRAAVEALVQLGHASSVEPLFEQLSSEHPQSVPKLSEDGLVALGALAESRLSACLREPRPQAVLDRCMNALGRVNGAAASALAQAEAGQKVSASALLRALSAAPNTSSLPTVLSHLTHADRNVRRTAEEAARSMLEALSPVSTAVDPIRQALEQQREDLAQVAIHLELLGKTRASRASAYLLPFALEGPLELRLVALRALGELREGGDYESSLVKLLHGHEPRVAAEAALALRKVGRPGLVRTLITCVERGTELVRRACLSALPGPMARGAEKDVVAAAVERMLAAVPQERDAWLEALSGQEQAVVKLREWLGSRATPADRRKAAEVLGGSEAATQALRSLLGDPEALVRANAVWAFGFGDRRAGLDEVAPLLRDDNDEVVINAVAAFGRLATGAQRQRVEENLCPLIHHSHPYVQENLSVALRALDASCPPVQKAGLAQELAVPTQQPRAPEPAQAGGSESVSVFVVPLGRTHPLPEGFFAARFADGFVRAGRLDRRGAFFERRPQSGPLQLLLPAHLVEL